MSLFKRKEIRQEGMVITIHHLGVSQSERIVWLVEELGLPYRLKWYDRKPNKAGGPGDSAGH